MNSNLNPLTKFTNSRSTEFKDIPPSHGKSLKWSWRPSNQLKNSHKSCGEKGYPALSLLESQWKLRQQHDQNYPMEEKPFLNIFDFTKEIDKKTLKNLC